MSNVVVTFRTCLLITASGEHGPRCLQCSTVEDPSHCGAVVECAVGQVIIRKLYSIITLLTCFHHSSIHVLVHIEPVYTYVLTTISIRNIGLCVEMQL